jgi:hypothetical protein
MNESSSSVIFGMRWSAASLVSRWRRTKAARGRAAHGGSGDQA